MVDSVQAFIDTLDPAQRTLLLQEHTFANASRWHTYPQWALGSEQARLGLALGELSTQQWQAFDALLKAATGSGARGNHTRGAREDRALRPRGGHAPTGHRRLSAGATA